MARPSSKASQKSKFGSVSDRINKSLGAGSAKLGTDQPPRTHVSSGCLSLDMALGGGWAKGRLHGVFGPRDIGKSTIVGLSLVREAQKLGLTCAWLAVEPGFDPEWARAHGVDPEDLFLIEPDTGEQAFEALYTVVTWEDPKFDVIIFDSIGMLLHETEISGKTGNDGKAKAGGQAGLVTWGTKRVTMPVSKRGQIVILLNQVREKMDSHLGGYKQPGGNALEHVEEAIVQLKVGGVGYKAKVAGSEVQIGQPIVAIVQRNKGNEGSKHRAVFDFYNAHVDGYPFGIDIVGDVLDTGKRAGIIRQGGAFYYLPGNDKGFYRKDLGDYFKQNPKELDQIRETILAAFKKGDIAAEETTTEDEDDE